MWMGRDGRDGRDADLTNARSYWNLGQRDGVSFPFINFLDCHLLRKFLCRQHRLDCTVGTGVLFFMFGCFFLG